MLLRKDLPGAPAGTKVEMTEGRRHSMVTSYEHGPDIPCCYIPNNELSEWVGDDVWRPEEGKQYFYIGVSGDVIHEKNWGRTSFDRVLLDFGNVFPNPESALAARDRIREVLKSMKG